MSITSEIRLRVRKEGDVVLNQLSAKLNDLASRSTLTTSKFNDLAATLRTTDSQIRTKSINGLNDYARAWRELANNVDITSKEFRQATQEAERFERAAAKAQGRRGGGLARAAQTAGSIAAAGIFGGPEGLIGAGIGAIAGGPLGAATGGAIGAQVGMFRQQLGGVATFAADLSRQRQALQLVTKDAGEYQRALSFIENTSRELAIPQELITRQFTQLTASVKGAGGNVRDAEKAFIGIAAGIRGTGGSLDQLDSALLATSQVFSKGKVSAEELRQQIGERLPGAFSLFAKSIDMTPQELDKALEKGQVSLQDFQTFAEKLFDEYGESAKILADGPDAAGDRLQTQLSELKEAIGPTLKDMGAAFQNFAAEAIKAFVDLGKEAERFARFMDEKIGGKLLDNAIKNVQYQDQVIKRLETESLVRIGGLSKEEKQQLSTARALRAGSMRVIEGAKLGPAAPEAPYKSALSGTQQGADQSKSEADKLSKIAQQNFNKTLQQLGVTLNVTERKFLAKELLAIESDIQAAIQDGNKQEVERLQLASRRVQLEVTENALLTEKDKLEKLINEGRSKGVDVTNATNKLAGVGAAIAENQLNLKRQLNAELELKREIADKYYKQFAYGGEFTQIPTVFSAFEEQIKSLREEIADSFPEMMQLADGLSSSFGNAFQNLVFNAQSATQTLAQFFGDIAKSFQNMVIQMINDYLKLAIISFFKNLFAPKPVSVLGNFFGGGEVSTFANPSFGVDTSGLVGPASPFAMGGIMTGRGPLGLMRYAAGGIATSPQLAMFGEGSRPEAYVPLPDGRTIPVTMRGGTEAGNIVVNVDATGSSVQGNDGESKRLGEAIGVAIRQELIKQKRPGGLLA